MLCAAKMSHLKILQGTGNDKSVWSRNAPKNDTTNSGVADYSSVRFFFFFFFFCNYQSVKLLFWSERRIPKR